MIEEDFRRVFLPYCLQKLKDGRYIVLNRLYKPLGVASSAWVSYEEHASVFKLLGMTAKKAAAMSHRGLDDVECIHFYADASIPTDSPEKMAAYAQRLRVLAALRIEM
jgi:hypothetical protein